MVGTVAVEEAGTQAGSAAPALAGSLPDLRAGRRGARAARAEGMEIIKVMDITQVPQVPPHVRGVINLRGKVIPVIDLRAKFGLPSQEATERTCIVVVDVALSDTTVKLGIVVDAVSEVLNVAAPEIDPAPEFGDRVSTDYMLGLAKVKGTVKILLDLDRVLGADSALGGRIF